MKITEKEIWDQIDRHRSNNGLISFVHSKDFDKLAKDIYYLIKSKVSKDE